VKTHPLNVAYLVVGLVYLGVAGSWALHAGGVIDTAQAGWLLPLTLVVAGAVGLAAFAVRGARRGRRDDGYDESGRPGEDISSLERAAFAPYPRDEERTRVLDSQDEGFPTHSAREGDDR
jgi:hypothetical protein